MKKKITSSKPWLLVAMLVTGGSTYGQLWKGQAEAATTLAPTSLTYVGVQAAANPGVPVAGSNGPVGGILNVTMPAGTYNASGRNCPLLGWSPSIATLQSIYGVGGYAGTPGSILGVNAAVALSGQAFNGTITAGLNLKARIDAAIPGVNCVMYGEQSNVSASVSRSAAGSEMIGVSTAVQPDAGITWFSGVGGDFTSGATGSLTTAYGVRAKATGVTNTYGVYAAVNTAGTNRFAIYGEVGNSATATHWAGYFNGRCFTPGNVWTPSDLRLKKNVQELNDNLASLSKLSPKTYEFKLDEYKGLALPEGPQLGLLVQDLEPVFPMLVTEVNHPETLDEKGNVISPAYNFKGVNYTGLIPVLIGGIQEQQAIITEKQTQIDALNERLTSLEKKMNAGSVTGPLSATKARLEQNTPNPFNENTVIRYALPEGAAKASIELWGANGQLVKSFGSLGTGNGQLMVAAGSLQAGSYTYVLLVNGERIDSKQMVITH
jgi:Chaperone of endosialidase